MSLDADGRVVELRTFVRPELFAAWGFPADGPPLRHDVIDGG